MNKGKKTKKQLQKEDEKQAFQLTDLIPLKTLQKLQDGFAESYDIPSIIYDKNGSPITQPSRFTEFCKLIRATKKGNANCEKFNASLIKLVSSEQKPYICKECVLKCIKTGSAPILIEGKHLANFTIGQMIKEGSDLGEIKKYAKEIGVDENKLGDAAKTLIRIDDKSFNSAVNFINTLTELIGSQAEEKLLNDRIQLQKKQVEENLEVKNLQLSKEKEFVEMKTHDLIERKKELSCLFYISRVVKDSGNSLDEIIQKIADIIPGSWKYPKSASVKITISGKEFKTVNYKDSELKQSCNIVIDKKKAGRIEVLYPRKIVLNDTEPFLKEEILLLDCISTIISGVVERERAVEEMQVSEQKRETWIQNSPVCTKVVDLNNNLVFMSSSGVKGLNIGDVNEYYGRPYPFHFYPDSFKIPMTENMRMAKETGKTIIQEAFVLNVDGNKLWYHSTIVPVNDEEGKLDYLLIVSLETTERKLAEEALRDSEEFANKIIASSSDCIKVLDLKGNLLWMNECGQKMLEIDDISLHLNKSWIEFWNKEDREAARKSIDKAIHGGVGTFSGYLPTMKSGSIKYWENIITPINDLDGNPYKLVACSRDNTERKKAEKALMESENLYRTLVETSTDGIVLCDLQGKYIYCNMKQAELLGYDNTGELIGKNGFDFFAPDAADAAKEISQKLVEEKSVEDVQFDIITKDGIRKTTEFSASVIDGADGSPAFFMCLARDITDRKLAENELESSVEKNQNLIAKMMNAFALHEMIFNEKGDPVDYKFLEVNPAWERILGIKAKMVIGKTIREIMPDVEDNWIQLYGRVVKSGIPEDIEDYNKGTQKYYHVYAYRPEPGKFAVFFNDVTERKKSEKQLKNAFTEVNKLKAKLERENVYLKEELADTYNYEDMVYASSAFGEVLSEVEQVAATNATVLVMGETGTGKELIARAIHNIGTRKEKPLIKVNCAAIPRELIESELFGHEKGSFTGAVRDRLGKFELADGGSLFLDEIGEMPLDLQPKLLRALQEGEIEHIGGTSVRKVDVRVIAATNLDLRKESEEGRFREDLYFRLNVFPMHIPALRERTEDIAVLVEFFVNKYAAKYNRKVNRISDDSMNQMKSYEWPGNVRELENTVERAIILSKGETLSFPSFAALKQESVSMGYGMTFEDVQRNHIVEVLVNSNWRVDGKKGAAIVLGMKPSTLRDRMKKLGISRPSR